MSRRVLTPGKLFAVLREEFERLRPEACVACPTPMVHVTMRHGRDAPNWTIGERFPDCRECEPLIADLVERLGHSFDIHDPDHMALDPRLVERNLNPPAVARGGSAASA